MQIWMQKDIHIIFSEKCKLQKKHTWYISKLIYFLNMHVQKYKQKFSICTNPSY